MRVKPAAEQARGRSALRLLLEHRPEVRRATLDAGANAFAHEGDPPDRSYLEPQ